MMSCKVKEIQKTTEYVEIRVKPWLANYFRPQRVYDLLVSTEKFKLVPLSNKSLDSLLNLSKTKDRCAKETFDKDLRMLIIFKKDTLAIYRNCYSLFNGNLVSKDCCIIKKLLAEIGSMEIQDEISFPSHIYKCSD